MRKRTQGRVAGRLPYLLLLAVVFHTPVPAQTLTHGGSPLGEFREIAAGVLRVGYADAGPADGPVIILLHGWPYDVHSFEQVVPLLVAQGHRVITPYLRGFGTTVFLSPDTPRNGQQAALADDIIALMDALGIGEATLAGFDWGARTADIIAAVWPDRVTALVSVSGYLIGSQQGGKAPLAPEQELLWWYQFYFATERGAAGYAAHTGPFARLIWRLASPQWDFSQQTFEKACTAFANPDHVAVVIDNYRWRLGITHGEARYDAIERILARGPVITVPTITVEGDANGAPHPDPSGYAARFTGRYRHLTLTGGVGHNPPAEAPEKFAEAVLQAFRLSGE